MSQKSADMKYFMALTRLFLKIKFKTKITRGFKCQFSGTFNL